MKYLLLLMIVCFACNQSQTSSVNTSNDSIVKKDNTEIKLKDTVKQNDVIQNDSTKQRDTVAGDLNFLKKFEGKYPYDVKLLDHPVLKKRLQKLLGSDYDFLKSIWQVETPIEINNGMFYAWAMQAHSGGDPGAVIMADINNNTIYVGIRKDKQEKFYTENGSNIPAKMQQWADEQ